MDYGNYLAKGVYMYTRLVKKYWSKFLVLALILIPCSICFMILGIIFWIQFAKFGDELLLALFFTILTIIMIPILMKSLSPFFKDLPYVKNRKILVIKGKVEEFEEVKSNGEPPTTVYYPIVKIKDRDERLKLCVDAELGECYQFAYLPNTKIAINLERCYD